MSNFIIGDKVVVIDGGKSYSSYDEWASRVGLNKWAEGNYLQNKDEGVVVAIAPWDTGSETILLAVEKDGKQYIIGAKGVEKYVKGTRTPAQKAGLILGSQYEVISTDCHSFKMGSVITFKVDDKTKYPVFIAENGDVQSLRPEQVKPYVDARTPAQKAGLVIGERYLISEECDHGMGVVVYLVEDDGSTCPFFNTKKDTSGTCYVPDVNEVTLYVEPKNTVIEFDKVLTEAQIAAIKTLVA